MWPSKRKIFVLPSNRIRGPLVSASFLCCGGSRASHRRHVRCGGWWVQSKGSPSDRTRRTAEGYTAMSIVYTGVVRLIVSSYPNLLRIVSLDQYRDTSERRIKRT